MVPILHGTVERGSVPLRSESAGSRRPADGTFGDDLQSLDLDGLRLRWRNLSGRAASSGLTRSLLIRMIAYHQQVARFGGLSAETERLLTRIAAEAGAERNAASSPSAKVVKAARLAETDRRYPPGTILVREWQGVLHRVTVMKDGFAWNGTVYRSLSRIAREITGINWNGHVFFGGRDKSLAARREAHGRKWDRSSASGASP